MKTFDLNGIHIEYTRKKVKNINLRIRPDGTVAVSAPMRLPEREVIRFLQEKEPWIRARLSAKHERGEIPTRQWATGEKVLLFGKEYDLMVESKPVTRTNHRGSHRAQYSVEMQEGTIVLTAPRDSSSLDRDRAMKRWYIEVFDAELSRMLPFWENRTGLYSSGYRIRDMKSQWGSCKSQTRGLCFNLQLVLYDRRLMEYVVLHELAHIEEPNHSADFWAIVEEYMPDWKARRRELRSIRPLYRPAE